MNRISTVFDVFSIVLQPIVLPPYSYLKASIGFNFEAFQAGRIPKTTQTRTENHIQSQTICGDISHSTWLLVANTTR